MKSLFTVVMFLFALIFVQCEKYDNVNEILEERFVFNKGDTLTYICSNGSADTFYVRDYIFFAEKGGGEMVEGWFGSYRSETYKTDHCEIYLESVNNTGKIHLGAQCDLTPWYKLRFNGDYNNKTISYIVRGCEAVSYFWEQYPTQNMTAKIINQNEFSDVYAVELDGQPYIVYWNLKYGIIRFEGINEASGLYWDLDGIIEDQGEYPEVNLKVKSEAFRSPGSRWGFLLLCIVANISNKSL